MYPSIVPPLVISFSVAPSSVASSSVEMESSCEDIQLIENVLRNDYNIFAVAMQISNESNNDTSVMLLSDLVNESFEGLEYIETQLLHEIHHEGCNLNRCQRCKYNRYYRNAAEVITEWEKLIHQKGIHFSSKDDLVLALLTLRFATGYYFNLFEKTHNPMYAHIPLDFKKYLLCGVADTLEKRYDIWNSMQPDNKKLYFLKAQKFRNYFNTYKKYGEII